MIAVGWKCMFFVWDPVSTMQQKQLFVRPADNGQPWPIDPRVKVPIYGLWFDPATGEICPNNAMTLDCFSSEVVNGQTLLSNRANLGLIEQILVRIQNTALQGQNPTEF
jgi:hypothetical protein